MWLLLVVSVAAEAFVALIVTFFIQFGSSTTCGDPAQTSNVRDGETALLVAICVGLVPWAILLVTSRQRLRLGVAGALGVSPLIGGLLLGLDPHFWSGSFCF